jgi:hypothetical protein
MLEKLPHTLYIIVLVMAAIGWLALILFPRRPWANFWFSGLGMPLVLGLFYTFVMLVYWSQEPTGEVSGFITLLGLQNLFLNLGLLLAGYIDLVVMPLILGAWMARKATQIRMPYIYLLPCLLLTFVVPGTGFVLFVVIVAIGRGWSQIAKFEGQPPPNSSPVFARPEA